jgi:hypothetical protein
MRPSGYPADVLVLLALVVGPPADSVGDGVVPVSEM